MEAVPTTGTTLSESVIQNPEGRLLQGQTFPGMLAIDRIAKGRPGKCV